MVSLVLKQVRDTVVTGILVLSLISVGVHESRVLPVTPVFVGSVESVISMVTVISVGSVVSNCLSRP